jgi:hypothetical protein
VAGTEVNGKKLKNVKYVVGKYIHVKKKNPNAI